MQIEVKFNETNTVLAAEFSHYIEGPGGGGGTVEDLDAVLDAQEGLIDELKGILATKASGGKAAVIEPLEVTENGTYEPEGIDGFAPVVVSVPIPDGYIQPEGALEVTENGAHDVTEYASVNVNVPIPDGYIMPSGSLEITENGTHDVAEYASVAVNVPTGGGSNTDIEDAILSNTLSGAYTNDRIKSLGGYHFFLTNTIEAVSFPNVTNTGTNTFQQCTILKSVSMPRLARVSNYMLYACPLLTQLDFPSATAIGTAAFQACTGLIALILRKATLCKLENKNALTRTPIEDGTGYIYVPAALVDSYKAATNWSTYASQFRALEDYTVDGTVTGELDPEKVGG